MKRNTIVLIVVVSSFFVATGLAAGALTPSLSQTAEEPPHTLEITSKNESVSYTVTSSESISPENDEHSYTVNGNHVEGTVGKSGNEKDIIHYDGHIKSFEYQSHNIEVKLNGKKVDPKILSGNHIKITHRTNKSGVTVSYYYPVIGDSEYGELAEDKDIANDVIIQGTISNGSDSFYFVGDIQESSFEGLTKVRINGQSLQEYIENSSSSTSSTPTDTTPTPSTTTAADSEMIVTTTNTEITTTASTPSDNISMSPTSTQPAPIQSDTPSASSLFTNDLVIGFGTGLILLLAGGIAGLFYLDRRRQ